MRTRSTFLSIVALATVITAVVSFTFVRRIARAQAKDTTALTATFRESLYDQSGTVQRAQNFFYAIRSDGSTVRGRSLSKPGNRGATEQRSIVNLSTAEEIVVDGLTQSITTIPLSKKLVEEFSRPGCTGRGESANRDTILGYEVIEVVDYSADRETRAERWLAPSLGCLALKTAYSHRTPESGSYRVVNVREALEVRVGEPAASLFEKPSGYVERAPSARRSEYYRRYPAKSPCPECVKSNDQEADEKYFGRQGDRGQ